MARLRRGHTEKGARQGQGEAARVCEGYQTEEEDAIAGLTLVSGGEGSVGVALKLQSRIVRVQHDHRGGERIPYVETRATDATGAACALRSIEGKGIRGQRHG